MVTLSTGARSDRLISGSGRIPVLVDNTKTPPFPVMETSAELLYLLKEFDTQDAFGFKDEYERNECLQWLFFWHGSVRTWIQLKLNEVDEASRRNQSRDNWIGFRRMQRMINVSFTALLDPVLLTWDSCTQPFQERSSESLRRPRDPTLRQAFWPTPWVLCWKWQGQVFCRWYGSLA